MAAMTCRIASAGGVAFGAYDVLAQAPTDTVLNIVVACDRDGGPPSVTVTMGLNRGTHGTSVSARRMRHASSASDFLNYGLYRDIGRSSTWGFSAGIDTVSRSFNVPNKGTASTTFTVYGRIPAQQDARVGSYSDSVQVTITP
jgi:spore coat protein U-like protein